MELVFKKEVAHDIGLNNLKPWGLSEWHSYRDTDTIDLAKEPKASIQKLHDMLLTHKTKRGVNVLIHDIEVWQRVQTDGVKDIKARTVRQFESLLTAFMLKVPGHRLYERHAEGAWLAYYVGHVKYSEPDRQRQKPASVEMTMFYEEVGGQTSHTIHFESDDCMHMTVNEALLKKQLFPEDDMLRADYLEIKERYDEVFPLIGTQFWGRGPGIPAGDRYERGILLDHGGEPAKVVVDVFNEKPTGERRKEVNFYTYFWPNIEKGLNYDEDTDTIKGKIDENTTLDVPEIEIPIHPWIVVFHLSKHRRLRCHVSQLELYVYDTKIADKLVLPEDDKALVKLLIDTKGGGFQDIVAGKSGGAVVLLTGEPGVGKTLTAEVYAESEERALYSVQCSQLGLNPENLEKSLLEVFDRCNRWNAVLLLDEADVYVHQRGNSLQQNAIVGVFLRVLEYQESTLFLTSNRPDDVDDAIASRCIARLFYTYPDPERATRIWHVLADGSDIPIDDYVIAQTVEANPTMSGRDIKNILKLANLMRKPGKPISFQDIEFVKQFKPTGSILKKETA